ncbi:MAG: hypothetical protein L6284_02510, partial [Brevundimonas sp.]|nr:hypothetical protein [Brevundimonas sp.]
MSPMPALLATAALLSLSAAPALAADPAPAQQGRTPAPAETRAAYERMDALSRSVFWAGEQ